MWIGQTQRRRAHGRSIAEQRRRCCVQWDVLTRTWRREVSKRREDGCEGEIDEKEDDVGWDGFFSWTVTLSKTHGDRQTVRTVTVT